MLINSSRTYLARWLSNKNVMISRTRGLGCARECRTSFHDNTYIRVYIAQWKYYHTFTYDAIWRRGWCTGGVCRRTVPVKSPRDAAMKSTDGDAEDAAERAMGDDPARVEYEESLARYNRQLAGVRSECGRLEAINDEAVAALQRAGERYEDVLGEFGRRIHEQQMRVDACETEKHRLAGLVAARQATSDEACERRQAQYDRVLAGLKSNRAFKESKWKVMSENRRHRANLIDAIHSVSEYADYLEVFFFSILYSREVKRRVYIVYY